MHVLCFVSYDVSDLYSSNMIWWEFILKEEKKKQLSFIQRPKQSKNIKFSADIIYTAKK